MPKKTLVRIEEGMTATSMAYGCAALLDAGLEEQLGPASPEEEGLDCGGSLAVRIARRMQLLRHHLEATGEALERIRDELHRWRLRREKTHAKLYDAAKHLREFCRGVFDGDEGDTFLGLHGALPREPKELRAAFAPVVRRLADAEWPLPESKVRGFGIDREELVKRLIKNHDELGQTLDAIKTGETRETVAKVAKRRAGEAHNTFLAKSCRYLEAALDLAGLDDLAAAVRPDVGRRGRPPKAELAAPAALPGENRALPAATGEQLPALPAAEGAENDAGASRDQPESPD